MNEKELMRLEQELVSSKKTNVKDVYDYNGYTVLNKLELSNEELKKAVNIMWEIVMTTETTAREEKYLFGKGLTKSMELFLDQKKRMEDVTGDEKETFNVKSEIFRQRLENVKPLVSFLIKIKEIL